MSDPTTREGQAERMYYDVHPDAPSAYIDLSTVADATTGYVHDAFIRTVRALADQDGADARRAFIDAVDHFLDDGK
jgi:hypothetical protein